MTANDLTMQFVADILDAPVIQDTTILGAARLAGYQAGISSGLAEFAATWRSGRPFAPLMAKGSRKLKWAGWQFDAVAGVRPKLSS